MSWVRLDDDFPDHKKVAGLSNDAFCLHVTAMCWVAKWQTDGKLPGKLLGKLAWRCQDPASAAAELVAANVWEVTPEGWEIHDFTQYNPTKEAIAELAAKRSEAGKAGAMAKWQNHSKLDGKPDGTSQENRWQTDGKNMPPVPSPLSPITETERDVIQSESSVYGSGGGNGQGTVDPSLFLTVIGFKDPEPFLKTVDATCLAMWAYHYATLTEPERKSVKSWPALINTKVRAGEQPRWKNGELKTAFYRAWTQ